MTFEILKPSSLTAEEDNVPAAKRLSVLAAETLLGRDRIRRRWSTGLKNHPQGLALFDRLDDELSTLPEQGPLSRWRPIAMYARDIAAALELVADVSRRGYLLTLQVSDQVGERYCSVDWVATAPPGAHGWRYSAGARATGPTAEAEAITTAYLILTGTIQLTEEPCPTPR